MRRQTRATQYVYEASDPIRDSICKANKKCGQKYSNSHLKDRVHLKRICQDQEQLRIAREDRDYRSPNTHTDTNQASSINPRSQSNTDTKVYHEHCFWCNKAGATTEEPHKHHPTLDIKLSIHSSRR